ncbi:amp dependent CoA ligase [Mucidula mucida]|nr:amp dependent CoA ligase [Mucidula mucida]
MEYSGAPLKHDIPNLTIPQFILDSPHPLSPSRPDSIPFFIEDSTGRKLHRSEVLSRVHGLANALSIKWKISENDVVCIFSPNHVDYPVSIWAVHRLGGIITPANPSYTHDELRHQLETAKAGMIIVHPSFFATALKAARSIGIAENRIILMEGSRNNATIDSLVAFAPGEAKTKIALLSFSSGTTGKAKGVEIPHSSVVSNILQMATHFSPENDVYKRIVPGDVSLGVLPFFHIYGLIVTLHYMLFCGLSVVVVPKFNFKSFLESIVRHRITHLFLVPPQIVLLCKHPAARDYDLKHVKLVMSGAAPLSGELVQQVTEQFPHAMIGQGYGLTETSTTITMLNPTTKIGTIGSAGRFIPGIVARVVKEDGSLAMEGEQGELVVRGPSMALRYHGNEKATQETFVDGWVRTGDEVIVRNGDVFVVDRLKEMMKVRGFQVAPAELEGHLLNHPSVVDACVVPVPDEYSGELPLAFVVVDPAVYKRLSAADIFKLKNELLKHVSDSKVPYKWLAGGIEFIDAIPKNPSGKILRRVLREQARKMRRTEPVTILAKL